MNSENRGTNPSPGGRPLLEGKVAVVTGGGAGIGKASVLAMARAGARVVFGNRSETAGQEVLAAVEALGGEARFVRTDVADPEACEALAALAETEFGGIDIGFNNAALEGRTAPFVELSNAELDAIIDVNIKGVFYAMRAQLRRMAPRGQGVILNTTSVLGLKAVNGLQLYTMTKHAVVGLTRAAAAEYAPQGIRVNAIAPGPVETQMLRNITGGDFSAMIERTPMGRVGQPEEIADAVVWACSDQASFMTGHVLTVDGGRCTI